MKKEILKLRSEGKTYNEIKKQLKCSKGTISYHCGEGQKEKYRQRQRRNRRTINGIIGKKIDHFIRPKVHNYKRARCNFRTTGRFNYSSAYKKIIENPVCYLTGRKIDLSNSRSYELDHIESASKGRSDYSKKYVLNNTLKNMGLLSRDVNRAKHDLSVDDFIQLCKEVCEHNGFDVIKKK
jgi:hypothetical protein